MKQIFLLAICITTLGCNNLKTKEEQDLLNKITQLEEQNRKLKDSLSKNESDFLYSQILIGVADEHTLKVGKNNNVVMLLQTFGKELPKYEIYKIEDKREIKIGENNQTRFNYQFVPKSIEDNELDLLVKIPFQGKVIKIPGKMIFDIKK
jgi:hypothetical protein